MMGGIRRGVVVAVCAVLVVSGTGVTASATVAENEPPLPEAGLDQDVVVNQTVFLDAGGSWDPDGEITGYEWAIETPGGATVTPECADCERTEFQVTQTGTYNATITVTDDDGAERSDTARITVEGVNPPTADLAGSTDVLAGDPSEYTATLESGDNALVRVEWYVDGELHDRRSVEGEEATETAELTFDEPGDHTVTVEAYDVMGRTDETSVSVDVSIPEETRPCLNAVWNGTTGEWDTDDCGPDSDTSDPGGGGGDSGDDSDSNGIQCSEYGSGDDKPQDETVEFCDDDRLLQQGDGGPVEVWDGNSDGEITLGPHNMTYEQAEEFANSNDEVEWDSAGKAITYESHESYEEITGVSPSINPDSDINQNPENYKSKQKEVDKFNTENKDGGGGGGGDGGCDPDLIGCGPDDVERDSGTPADEIDDGEDTDVDDENESEVGGGAGMGGSGGDVGFTR